MGVVAKLSAKYQISIPKDVREQQGWKPGQMLAFVPQGTGYVLVPVPELADLRGIARNAATDGVRDRSDRLERYK